jgi:hypothetical protein
MIQYSSINDAWGNKEMYKKNTINNIDGFTNIKQIDKFIQPKPVDVETFIQQVPQVQQVPQEQKVETFIQQVPQVQQVLQVPQEQKVETFIQQVPQVPQEQKVETYISQIPKVETFVVPHNEDFYGIPSTSTMRTSCGFAEHLKSCDHCRNSLSEYFDSGNSVSTINIFGLKINITKDVLKIIFVIIIVLIFIIVLSTINVSLKDTRTHMKYYMVPQVSNIPMHNVPFYH